MKLVVFDAMEADENGLITVRKTAVRPTDVYLMVEDEIVTLRDTGREVKSSKILLLNASADKPPMPITVIGGVSYLTDRINAALEDGSHADA